MKKPKNMRLSRKLYLYLAVGVSAFMVEYLSFTMLTITSLTLIAAQSMSFSCGLLVSFIGNRKLTFSSKHANYVLNGASQLRRYMALAFINLILSNIVIYSLVEEIELPPLVAKVVVMAAVVSWNFLIFNKLIFRTEKNYP